MAICKRAHSGMIRARAERWTFGGRVVDKPDLPAKFWWAEGHEALKQDWTAGDFDTWIDDKAHLQAFGVTFLRADIEKMIPPEARGEGALLAQGLYLELERLVAEMPDLLHGAFTPEMNAWLGDAATLVKMLGDAGETAKLHVAAENLHGLTRQANAHTIVAVVNRALSLARRSVPEFQGALIEGGKPHDAFTAVGRVLRTARLDALFVDRYADEKLIEEFLPLLPAKVGARILTTKQYKQPLKTAASLWAQQHGEDRPLAVRLVSPDIVHERSIVVDGKKVWEPGRHSAAWAEARSRPFCWCRLVSLRA